MPSPDPRPISALPSPRARAVAFAAILLAGLCGALIGWGIVDVSCRGSCSSLAGLAAVVSGVVAAAGVSVVAVLALRAMGEWRRVREDQLFAEERQGSTTRRNPPA